MTCEYGGRSGRTDFPFLIRFLRARKFNVDKAADLYKGGTIFHKINSNFCGLQIVHKFITPNKLITKKGKRYMVLKN